MRNLGQRIILLGVFIVSVTRVIAHTPIWGGPYDLSGPMFLTDNGSAMWVYVVLWGVGAVLALIGMIRGKAGLAILWYVFLMLTWSAGYMGAWIVQEGDRYTRAWMSAALYGGNGINALGAFYLMRHIDDRRASDITEAHKIVRRDE
jgi:hypothetical protein